MPPHAVARWHQGLFLFQLGWPPKYGGRQIQTICVSCLTRDGAISCTGTDVIHVSMCVRAGTVVRICAESWRYDIAVVAFSCTYFSLLYTTLAKVRNARVWL